MRVARLATVLLLVTAACGHGLENGGYTLTQAADAKERVVDTCHLLADDGTLPGASLIIAGQQVTLDWSLLGRDGSIRMLGRFKKTVVGEPDAFSVDGSVVNATVCVRDGQQTRIGACDKGAADAASCLIPFGQVHMDATVAQNRSDRFEGVLTVHHELEPNQDPRCPLACDVSVSYAATKAPEP